MSDNITLDADFLMKHLIISAMRYDASRSSYIVSDLIDIAKLIHNNRDKFNSDRVAWLARDLREQASDRLRWLSNVNADNTFNDRIVTDAYTLIAKHLQANPDMRFCDYDWEVDCVSGEVYADKRETPLVTNGGHHTQTLYDCDISTIADAANIIDTDCHRIVVSEYEGEVKETLCFPSVLAEQIWNEERRVCEDYSYKMQWKPVDRPHVYLIDEYIKEVKETAQ